MALAAPDAPQELKVQASLRRLRVDWEAPSHGTVSEYTIRARYYALEMPRGEMLDEATATVGGDVYSKELTHPNLVWEGKDLMGCTVKVTVVAMFQKVEGGSTTVTTSWFDMIGDDAVAAKDLANHMQALAVETADFRSQKMRPHMEILVVGMQHHGKSSFSNSLRRCFAGDMSIADELHTAPASLAAVDTTVDIKTTSLAVTGGSFKMHLRDLPAFANVVDENGAAFDAALAAGLQDGVRRQQFVGQGTCLRNAPDAAIVVVSAEQWADQRREVSETVQRMARRFQNAVGGRVSFPYVVAVTKCDSFLHAGESNSKRTYEDLLRHVEEIRQAANTQKVFLVTNYKVGGCWSKEVNRNVFRLLRELTAQAKKSYTNVAVDKAFRDQYVIPPAAVVFFTLFVAMVCSSK